MGVDILYITFNRLAYTRQTLPVMIENAGADFSLTIVDNGSSDGTVNYLKSVVKSYKSVIKTIVFNKDNQGLSRPTNQFWRDSQSTFVGKVDNDTLLPPGWLKTLLHAHMQSDRLGVVGGFHHRLEDVNMEKLRCRVINVDGVNLLPDAFIGGCCYIFKRSLQRPPAFFRYMPR